MTDLRTANQRYVAASLRLAALENAGADTDSAPPEAAVTDLSDRVEAATAAVLDAADALSEAVKAHLALPHGTLEGYVDLGCRCHFCKQAAELTLEAIRETQKEREERGHAE